MLLHLSLENFVTIHKLQISFSPGLTVLTGQTGAGKSILLDGLSLCLGSRADLSMVRKGCEKATISAVFNISECSHIRDALIAADISTEGGELIVRRSLVKDGNSRCYLNDSPVSLTLLQEITPHLMEIHQQFDRLLDVASHRDALDEYAQHQSLQDAVRKSFHRWKAARDDLSKLKLTIEDASRTRDLLEHQVKELAAFEPVDNEETSLLERRQTLKQKDQVIKIYQQVAGALNGDVRSELLHAVRSISKLEDETSKKLSEDIDALLSNMTEISANAEDYLSAIIGAEDSLEIIEDRLFELRRLSRKYNVLPEDLRVCLMNAQEQLDQLENAETNLGDLEKKVAEEKSQFEKFAQKLSASRKNSAQKLDANIHEELGPLKLGNAVFKTQLEILPEHEWGAYGIDKIEFMVDMNQQENLSPLRKVASGGEMSRLMLALKVSLARSTGLNPGLVFDEVDTGVGGDVADAVGQRLKRLSQNLQVLVITHSPQVASAGDHHWVISKDMDDASNVSTSAFELDSGERIDEIARMLSGSKITPEAKAAAEALISRNF